jgi:hypothetical protein
VVLEPGAQVLRVIRRFANPIHDVNALVHSQTWVGGFEQGKPQSQGNGFTVQPWFVGCQGPRFDGVAYGMPQIQHVS